MSEADKYSFPSVLDRAISDAWYYPARLFAANNLLLSEMQMTVLTFAINVWRGEHIGTAIVMTSPVTRTSVHLYIAMELDEETGESDMDIPEVVNGLTGLHRTIRRYYPGVKEEVKLHVYGYVIDADRFIKIAVHSVPHLTKEERERVMQQRVMFKD